jgi:hypothetical protein
MTVTGCGRCAANAMPNIDKWDDRMKLQRISADGPTTTRPQLCLLSQLDTSLCPFFLVPIRIMLIEGRDCQGLKVLWNDTI